MKESSSMPNRRVPQHLLDYLGPCRQPDTPAEKVVEQCHLAKFEEDGTLSDFDPLIVIMHLVAEEVRGLRLSPHGPKGRKAWIEAMSAVQTDGVLEHNTCIPCRYCDQAFEPVIDKKLLKLYLTWEVANRGGLLGYSSLSRLRRIDYRGKALAIL